MGLVTCCHHFRNQNCIPPQKILDFYIRDSVANGEGLKDIQIANRRTVKIRVILKCYFYGNELSIITFTNNG